MSQRGVTNYLEEHTNLAHFLYHHEVKQTGPRMMHLTQWKQMSIHPLYTAFDPAENMSSLIIKLRWGTSSFVRQ